MFKVTDTAFNLALTKYVCVCIACVGRCDSGQDSVPREQTARDESLVGDGARGH